MELCLPLAGPSDSREARSEELLSLIPSQRSSSESQLYQLLAKGTTMSEQKPSFMASLDEWTAQTLIIPMLEAMEKHLQSKDAESDAVLWQLDGAIKGAVREKVLESYRNGQAVGTRKFKRS